MSRPTVVIGAGIAGLTAALRLQQAGVAVQVLEASPRAGGAIASTRQDGHLFEQGPTTVMSTAQSLGRLIDDAGLRSRAVLSRPLAGRRLVWRRQRLSALPEKPPQLLRCRALSLLGRARLLCEPLIPAQPQLDETQLDETLQSFGHRRLGREATAAFLEPFVTGVFAGRIDQLGTDALPKLRQLEQQHGSLLRAMLAARKQVKTVADSPEQGSPAQPTGPAPLISFPEGLQELPDRLAQQLGERGGAVHCGHEVMALRSADDQFEVEYRTSSEGRQQLKAKAVVLATPAATAGRLLRASFAEAELLEFLEFLEQLPHPALATVGLGFRRQDVAHPLDAFGLLCAADSPIAGAPGILGVLFTSSIFEHRAAQNEVSLTVMVGGARLPAAAEAPDDELLAVVRLALKQLIGANGEPTTSTIRRWPRSIPQYLPGHLRHVAALRKAVSKIPNLTLAGNYLDGPGLEAAAFSGDQAAASLLAARS